MLKNCSGLSLHVVSGGANICEWHGPVYNSSTPKSQWLDVQASDCGLEFFLGHADSSIGRYKQYLIEITQTDFTNVA